MSAEFEAAGNAYRLLFERAGEMVCLLDLGMTPQEALAQPRVHHQWFPNELLVEKTLPRLKLIRELLGHGLRAGLIERAVIHLAQHLRGGGVRLLHVV